tara:strand:+ start:1180 stop:2805 length:1626 start_codon:yes stop_codon:yes gene_type:complete
METKEETEAREKKLVDDTKKFAQGALRKVGINITNPLAGLDELPTTEESLDADSLKIYQDANKPIKQLQGFAEEGLKTSLGLYGAALGTYGTVANQPRNMINITKDVEEIFSMNPNAYRRAVTIYKNHEGGISWKKAMDIARRNKMQMNIGYGNEIVNKGAGFNYLPNPSDDTLLDIHKDLQASVPSAAPYEPKQLDIPFDKAKLAQYQKDMRNTNIPQQVRTDMALSVKGSAYKTSEPFNYFDFKGQTKYIKDKGRRFLSIFHAGLTQYGASKAASFNVNQPIITAPLKEEYKNTNLPKTSFQVHHKAALKAIMGNFHGLDIGSLVFNKVSDAILAEVPWLGLGDNPENWTGIIGSTADRGTPHQLAHKYYDKIVGPSGEKFYTQEVVDRMMVDEEFRIEKATEIGRIINKSNRIVTQATELWKLGFSNKQRFKNFDALVDHLSKFDELGYDALSDPEYEAGVFTDIVTQIATDPSMVPPPEPKNTRGQQVLQDLYRLEKLQKDTKDADLSLKEQQKPPEPLTNEQQLDLDDLFPTEHRD